MSRDERSRRMASHEDFLFFFSSRRRHTRFDCDWSSDVCSSDLLVYPAAKVDPRVNPKLMQAATIAQERAHAHSKSRCWHYVKEALLASGVIDSRDRKSVV